MRPRFITADCLEYMREQPDGSVDLVMGSPPYHGKMSRYIGSKRRKLTLEQWATWMADVVGEAARISTGYCIIVANGCVRKRAYQPSCEMLMVECYRRGIVLDRPCIWHKNAPPNRKDWFGNDWEYCMAFRRKEAKPVWNWDAIAHAPKYTKGGRFRQRTPSGKRRLGNAYPKLKLARPRDVLRVLVGGGHMGSKVAHDNEAPFPEKLVEPFVLALTNKGDCVLDPFSGCGTTARVACRLGRRGIGVDERSCQAVLAASG